MCRLCQEKFSSQPRRQMPWPTQALECLHLQLELCSQADACECFYWILTKDSDAGRGSCLKRVDTGSPAVGGAGGQVSVPAFEVLSLK